MPSGVFSLPLAVVRLVRGSAVGVCGVCPGGRGVRTGRGWSGRGGGRPGAGAAVDSAAGSFCPQGGPLVLAVPAFGQVEGEAVAACRAVRAATAIRSRRMIWCW